MKSYNYRKNLKSYWLNSIIFIFLLLIVSAKIINTTKVYEHYKQGKAAFDRQDYIAAERIYTEVYAKTNFTYFTNEIRNALKTEEITFIKQSITFLENIKDEFQIAVQNNEVVGMLEIHNRFDTRLAEVKQSLNEVNGTNYNTLIEKNNIKSLFLTEFENVGRQFQADIDNSIESEDFIQGIDFILYSQVLEKINSDVEENKHVMEQDMKKYYVAKLDWLIREDNLENLLVETQQIINDYGNLMAVEWVVDRATEFTIRKMEDSIRDNNYLRYKTVGARYFTYLSQLPPKLSSRDEIKQLVNNQLESDYKKTKSYIAKNKFEEAKLMYAAMEEYIAIADNTMIDLEQLNQEIDTLWTKNDPIRMFSPLVLTEISKGKSKWGREAYVLATDETGQKLYWGEFNSQEEIKMLETDISAYDVQDIFISPELSTQNNPVIMVKETDGHGGTIYNGYRVEEDNLRNILHMKADYFEVKKQGKILLAYDSSLLETSYYELIDGEYINVFVLEDIEMEGSNEYGYTISGPENTYSSYEIDAVRVYATIRKGHNNNGLVQGSLGISYKDPYGSVLYHSESSDHYTWSISVNTSDMEPIEVGLRSDYSLGMYKVEFSWGGIKIAQSQFTITE